MISSKKEAVIYMVSGQRRYGNIIEQPENGEIRFLSFLNEQVFGLENHHQHIEIISPKEIHEIDFCLK